MVTNRALQDSFPTYFYNLISCYSPFSHYTPVIHHYTAFLPSVSRTYPDFVQLLSILHAVFFAWSTFAQFSSHDQLLSHHLAWMSPSQRGFSTHLKEFFPTPHLYPLASHLTWFSVISFTYLFIGFWSMSTTVL